MKQHQRLARRPTRARPWYHRRRACGPCARCGRGRRRPRPENGKGRPALLSKGSAGHRTANGRRCRDAARYQVNTVPRLRGAVREPVHGSSTRRPPGPCHGVHQRHRLAIAKGLAAEGAQVTITGRNGRFRAGGPGPLAQGRHPRRVSAASRRTARAPKGQRRCSPNCPTSTSWSTISASTSASRPSRSPTRNGCASSR